MKCRCLANAALLFVAAGLPTLSFAQSVPSPTANGNISANATAPVPAPVQVTSHGNQIEVKVPDQAPLNTVMSSICQQQKLKCSGMESLASYHGPAMSVDGTLRQVISKLVEGTDINYEFSRSDDGGATAIAFLGHAPRGTAPVPTPEQPAPAPGRPLHSRPFPGKIPPEAGPPPDTTATPQSQAVQPQAAVDPDSQPMQTDPEQQKKSEEAAKILFIGSGNPDTGMLPFPDAHGNPIPKTDSAATALPFPDQNGNPIPVKPAQGGSPFPMKPSPPLAGSSNNQ